jgi:AcrR family transcriptional regulator
LPVRAPTDRRTAQISARKQPRQARSADLVAAVLEAAVRVLGAEGAQRFTMARVAEKAGVSVGSLYQYFPNKAAILFRLQSDEWRQTAQWLRDILEDTRDQPLDRLRRLVHAFIRSECEEAAIRQALDDAAPLYRDAPEAKQARESGCGAMERFMTEALPQAPAPVRNVASDIMMMTLSAVGKQVSAVPRSAAEIDAYADAVADMVCCYLASLRQR